MFKILFFMYRVYYRLSKRVRRVKSKFENYRIMRLFEISNGKIGKGVTFGSDVFISGFNNICIGNNVHIGSGCFIRGEGGLLIEDNVIISRNVVIYTQSHNYDGGLLPFDATFKKSQVTIRKNSWVGMNVTISPGTIIGEGAIIGLGTVVFGEIPNCGVIGSNKPLIIKYRDITKYNNLEKEKKYAKEDGKSL